MGWPRIPGVNAVRVAELSVVQSLGPGGIGAFRRAIEFNARSLYIGQVSEASRADIELLAVVRGGKAKVLL
jgi:hypothetical protein